MKHLKIENRKAFFKRESEWVVVTEMSKNDLLVLAHAAIEDADFEIDPYDDTLLPNPADKIIYHQVSEQLEELHKKRLEFLEEVKNIYKEAYEKYCIK